MQVPFQILILIFLFGTHITYVQSVKACAITSGKGGCTSGSDTHCRLKYDAGNSKWIPDGAADDDNAGCTTLPAGITVDQCGGKGDGVRCYVAAASAAGTALDPSGKCTDAGTCVNARSVTASCDGTKVCQKDNPKCKAVKKAASMKREAVAAKKYTWAPPVVGDAPGCVYEAKSGCQDSDNPKTCYVPTGNVGAAASVASCGTCFGPDGGTQGVDVKCDGTNKCTEADPVCVFAMFEGKEGWHPNGTKHGCYEKGTNVIGTCTGTDFCILKPIASGTIDLTGCTTQCTNAKKQKVPDDTPAKPSGPSSSGSSLCYLTILLVIISLLYI